MFWQNVFRSWFSYDSDKEGHCRCCSAVPLTTFLDLAGFSIGGGLSNRIDYDGNEDGMTNVNNLACSAFHYNAIYDFGTKAQQFRGLICDFKALF